MTAIARLAAISLDCADTAELGRFYSELLGLEPFWETPEMVALRGAGVFVTMQRIENHQPASWPDGSTPKQLHLELAVTDLDAAEERALALGAVKADSQPAPDRWRVFVDPAGHPFCFTTVVPD